MPYYGHFSNNFYLATNWPSLLRWDFITAYIAVALRKTKNHPLPD